MAFRKWHLARGEAAKGGGVDRGILRLRDRIRDLRNALNAVDSGFGLPERPARGITTHVPSEEA